MSKFDDEDKVALDMAMSLVREVMDKHISELTTAMILRFNEAIDDILRGKKMLEESGTNV